MGMFFIEVRSCRGWRAMRGFAATNLLSIGATIAEIGLGATARDIDQRSRTTKSPQRIGTTHRRTANLSKWAERRRRGSQEPRRSTARRPVSVAKLDEIEANTLLT